MSVASSRQLIADRSTKHSRALKAPSRSKRNRKSGILTVIVWCTLAYFLIPPIWIFMSATKTNSDFFSTFGLSFGSSFELFTNIEQVFTLQGGVFVQWIINTLFYSVTSAVGASILATACGYALAKYTFRGRSVIFSVILGAVMVPMTALAIPTFLLFSVWDLTNTPLAVILPSLVSPFAVYLMRVYAAEAVDDSLLEAARIDGASEMKIFLSIGSRLLVPGIVTVLLFTLVATWNNYFLPLIMLNTNSLYPLTVGLASWQADSAPGAGTGTVLYTTVMTGSLISMVPLIVAFIFLQRYWQTGVTTGSVKG